MDINQYVEIYHRGGLTALNGALEALDGRHLVDLLHALQKNGFEIMWHHDSEERDRKNGGVVVAGYDEP
jgi:hypothetical protein